MGLTLTLTLTVRRLEDTCGAMAVAAVPLARGDLARVRVRVRVRVRRPG